MTLLAGSTRLHRLHRHASEPSGRQESEVQYWRIAGVHGVHMCLTLTVSTITHSDRRRCALCGTGAAETPADRLCTHLIVIHLVQAIRMPYECHLQLPWSWLH